MVNDNKLSVAQTTSLVFFLLIVIDYADEQFRRTVL